MADAADLKSYLFNKNTPDFSGYFRF